MLLTTVHATLSNKGLIYKGRTYYRLSNLKQISPGKYTVKFNNDTYHIDGGLKLGGSANEWFLSGPEIKEYIDCKSVADALRLLDNM